VRLGSARGSLTILPGRGRSHFPHY
jgi:hypothetical protein